MFVNGTFCKNPKAVKPADFFFSELNRPAITKNQLGVNATAVNDKSLPGHNTPSVAMARIDFVPFGVNPPHYHPRGSELLFVTKGKLYVGFVTSSADGNRLFAKVLNEGDAFVFPIGLIHFQRNIRNAPAGAFSAFGSQRAGVVPIANAAFGSVPHIKP